MNSFVTAAACFAVNAMTDEQKREYLKERERLAASQQAAAKKSDGDSKDSKDNKDSKENKDSKDSKDTETSAAAGAAAATAASPAAAKPDDSKDAKDGKDNNKEASKEPPIAFSELAQ